MAYKVVYIDDEELLCENFSDYFNSKDIQVITFVDPQEAVKYLAKEDVDLLLIDYRLPGMTGDQLAQLLPAKIPKLLVTGEINVITSYRFEQIIPKPYKPEQIKEAFKTFLIPKNAPTN